MKKSAPYFAILNKQPNTTMTSMRNKSILLASPIFLLLLGGCGTLTGLPSHGGGKRFAVEQELIAAATRGAIKQIDLSTIRGKKINLFVNAIGDTGAGNIVGGRFTVASQIRGDYIQSPATVEKSIFPRYTSTTSSNSNTSTTGGTIGETQQNEGSTTTTTTGATTSNSATNTNTSGTSSTSTSSNSVTSGQSITDTLLPYPERKTTQQKGSGGVAQVGVEYKGIGAYQNSPEVSSNDLLFLSGLLQTYLFLSGVYVVPPSEAEIDVYVTVDVFGTVRTRVEWFIANNEILKAKTSMEVLAVDHHTGKLVMPPQSSGAEAEYNEQYILWAGPVIIKESLSRSRPPLSDFSELQPVEPRRLQAERDVNIDYPFQNQVEKWWTSAPLDSMPKDTQSSE